MLCSETPAAEGKLGRVQHRMPNSERSYSERDFSETLSGSKALQVYGDRLMPANREYKPRRTEFTERIENFFEHDPLKAD